MAVSSLERFIERERPDLTSVLSERRREQARKLDAADQAVLGGWCDLVRHVVVAFDADPGAAVLARYAEAAEGYRPTDRARGRPLLAAYYGAFVSGAMADLQRGEQVALDGAKAALLEAHRGQGSGEVPGRDAVAGAVITDLRSAGLSDAQVEQGVVAVFPWQRLLWLAGCRDAPGLDEGERLAYLLRLAANQPVLGDWPALSRFVPDRAEKVMPLSADAYRRFRRDGIPDDPALVSRLAWEILNERHYLLEGISVVEVDELGIARVILSPEIREGEGFRCGVMVDHTVGSIAAEVLIAEDSDRPARALTYVPALEARAARAGESDEARAAIELLVLAIWRDLVVPRVRDEQYEGRRTRKARGRGRRSQRRGGTEVNRYLPRTLVYRRARQRAARTAGRRNEPPRLYAVGTFARRLPEGQRRSREADKYAHEIGMPLADHQTVVHPHFRGGTAEERENAMQSSRGDEIRTWRSWSALDLLRTRAVLKDRLGEAGS